MLRAAHVGCMKHIDMRRLTPAAQEERRRQVVGLRESGLTYAAIGRQVGLSRNGVMDICKRYEAHGMAGLQTRPSGPEVGTGLDPAPGVTDPPVDLPCHSRRLWLAVCVVEPRRGGRAGQATLRRAPGGAQHGAVSPALGVHAAEAVTAGL